VERFFSPWVELAVAPREGDMKEGVIAEKIAV